MIRQSPALYDFMALDSSILIYGHEPMLLDTRRWVLESAGYKVATVSELMLAREAMAGGGLALCILCHTLTPEERRVALAAASHQPRLKTLTFRPTRQAMTEEAISGETIDVFRGAAGLIATTRKLLS